MGYRDRNIRYNWDSELEVESLRLQTEAKQDRTKRLPKPRPRHVSKSVRPSYGIAGRRKRRYG